MGDISKSVGATEDVGSTDNVIIQNVGATGRSPVQYSGRSPLRCRSPHHRRSIRMKGFNYANSSAYFVTICANNRKCLFGNIADGIMALNEFGIIVREEWEKSANIRREITLEIFAIMPNHIHGIVVIQNTDTPGDAGAAGRNAGATGRSPLPNRTCGPTKKSLGAFIAGFKSAATKRINQLRKIQGKSVWQRNYYEHIVRDENELNRIRQYIMNNPLNWATDLENPHGRGDRPVARTFQPVAPTQNPEKSSGVQL